MKKQQTVIKKKKLHDQRYFELKQKFIINMILVRHIVHTHTQSYEYYKKNRFHERCEF